MKIKYTNRKTSKRTDEKCRICGRLQSVEDLKYGWEKCNWQKNGIDVTHPYWINYHESKEHYKTAPCQYSTSSKPVWITKNGKKKRIS